MPAVPMWKVKPGRVIYDAQGAVKATSGDLLPMDDPDVALRRSSVVQVMHEPDVRVEKAAPEPPASIAYQPPSVEPAESEAGPAAWEVYELEGDEG